MKITLKTKCMISILKQIIFINVTFIYFYLSLLIVFKYIYFLGVKGSALTV